MSKPKLSIKRLNETLQKEGWRQSGSKHEKTLHIGEGVEMRALSLSLTASWWSTSDLSVFLYISEPYSKFEKAFTASFAKSRTPEDVLNWVQSHITSSTKEVLKSVELMSSPVGTYIKELEARVDALESALRNLTITCDIY